MKKQLTILFTSLVFATGVITSCKKFEDGPLIRTNTVKGAVSKKWTLDKVLINDEDKTFNYSSYVEEYRNDGVLTISENGNFYQGTWELSDDKKYVTQQIGWPYNKVYILRLSRNEFWYSFIKNNKKYEIHLKKD